VICETHKWRLASTSTLFFTPHRLSHTKGNAPPSLSGREDANAGVDTKGNTPPSKLGTEDPSAVRLQLGL
jgi:hypothetical protein